VQHAEVRAWFADPASEPDGEHTTVEGWKGRPCKNARQET
jgi:hypothetical protein